MDRRAATLVARAWAEDRTARMGAPGNSASANRGAAARGWLSFFFFSSRRRHTRFDCDWSSDVCSSDLWSEVERQDGDATAYRFSFYERVERPRQVPCWITWAGEEVKDIIRRHLKESALYGGAIAARGPRYCPSVEDKIVKFPDAQRHQVFLERSEEHTSELQSQSNIVCRLLL